jgi:hypothetical protein
MRPIRHDPDIPANLATPGVTRAPCMRGQHGPARKTLKRAKAKILCDYTSGQIRGDLLETREKGPLHSKTVT